MPSYLIFLSSILSVLIAQVGLAQGQAEPIHICSIPEFKTNARGKQVPLNVEYGDKLKGFLYQSARPELNCGNAQNPSSAVTTYNLTFKIHGQSSQSYKQKSYQIEFRDQDFKSLSSDQQLRFAGLPKGEKFILTSNYIDRSDMRNPLAYTLASELGRTRLDSQGKPDGFGTPFTMAELTVDGNYKGLYTLSARAERGKERVDIAKVTEDRVQNFDWIGEICTGVSDADYHSKRKTFIAFRYPESDALKKFKDPAKASLARQKMIDDIERVEDILAGPNFADPLNGYASVLDVPSFIDFILLQELAKNVDGFRRSVWFRYVGGKIKMGPVWDFDAAFGNLITYNMELSSGWLLDFGQDTWYSPGGLERFPAAFWFRRLVEDPAFASQLKARYGELRKPGQSFDEAHIDTWIAQFQKDIGDAGQRSEKRWRWTFINPLHSVIFHSPPFDRTYEGNVTILKKWIKNRLSWMDQNIQKIEIRYRL